MKLKFSLFLFIFFLVSSAYVLGIEKHAIINQTLFLIFPILATLTGLLALKTYGLNNATGKSLFLITTGLFFWAVGEIVWYIFKNLLNIDPFPSIADGFFILGYPFIVIGLYKEFKKAHPKPTSLHRILPVSYTLIALLLTASVLYFGVYSAYDSTADFLNNMIAISYGIGDLFLIINLLFVLSMIQAYSGGRLAAFWKAITLGFLLFLVADIIFAIYNIEYTENIKPYIYIDLLWMAGYLSLAYALLDNCLYIHKVKKRIQQL